MRLAVSVQSGDLHDAYAPINATNDHNRSDTVCLVSGLLTRKGT